MNRHSVVHSLSLNYSIQQVSEFPAEDLKNLKTEAENVFAMAQEAKAFLDAAIERKYIASLKARRETLQKGSGEVRFEDDGFEIVADREKKVDWDQQALADIANNIRKNGNDPQEFLEINYTVSEQTYGEWPIHLRDSFVHARTVSYGKQVIEILDL